MRDNVKIERMHEGEIDAFRESQDSSGRASSADVDVDGAINSRLQGAPTQGEQDSLAVARILVERLNAVEKLNAERGDWEQPEVGPREPADCITHRRSDPRDTLEIQVVRALVDKSFYRAWKDAADRGENQIERADALNLAERLRDAIKHKSDDKALPPEVRKDLVLALDATRLSALALPRVAAEFRASYHDWTIQQGFKAVWLVGPTANMTIELH